MRVLRISTARAVTQHMLGGIPVTVVAHTAILWSHAPHRASRNVDVHAEAPGLTESDAVANLVKGWRGRHA